MTENVELEYLKKCIDRWESAEHAVKFKDLPGLDAAHVDALEKENASLSTENQALKNTVDKLTSEINDLKVKLDWMDIGNDNDHEKDQLEKELLEALRENRKLKKRVCELEDEMHIRDLQEDEEYD